MSRLSNLLRQVEKQDPQLAADLKREMEALSGRRAFGLNFERHIPETVELPHRPVRRGDKVRFLPERGEKPSSVDRRLWRVGRIRRTGEGRVADLVQQQAPEAEHQIASRTVDDLVVVAEFRDPIYPGLVSTGKVECGGDRPFHTVINAENFYALQVLLYTHAGKVDAIYIDPPYNTGARETRETRSGAMRSPVAPMETGSQSSRIRECSAFREPPNFEAPLDVLSTSPPSGAGDNEYIVVVRVSSGPVSRDRTVEQPFAVRVIDDNTESPGAPDAPRLTLALQASLTVEWTEPKNPGPPITGYDVQYREGRSGFFTDAPHEGTGRTATLYEVQVRASNEEGTGRWSQPGEGLTLDGPSAGLPFSVPDQGGVSLTSQDAAPALRVGYGQVGTDEGMTPPVGLAIFGFRSDGILVSEAGVPATAAVLEGRIFAETDGTRRTRTGPACSLNV